MAIGEIISEAFPELKASLPAGEEALKLGGFVDSRSKGYGDGFLVILT